MAVFPLFMEMDKKKWLVIGGGQVALRKIRTLVDFGADVTVMAPDICPELSRMADQGLLTARERSGDDILDLLKEWPAGEAAPDFGVCATSDKTLNHAAAVLLKDAGVLVDSATCPEDGDFLFPSVIRRENVTVGISTGGRAPGASRRLRAYVEQTLPRWVGEWAKKVGDTREWILKNAPETGKRKEWLEKTTEALWEEYACPGHEKTPWEAWVKELEKAEGSDGDHEL